MGCASEPEMFGLSLLAPMPSFVQNEVDMTSRNPDEWTFFLASALPLLHQLWPDDTRQARLLGQRTRADKAAIPGRNISGKPMKGRTWPEFTVQGQSTGVANTPQHDRLPLCSIAALFACC